MSSDVNWDLEKYREDHECEEHWELRRAFLERWKDDFPEERLVCLARVFANIEFMGCRYPTEVMLEVARLSQEIAKDYRKSKKNKLQRTFVSASTAAEDRAKGVKRAGGVVVDGSPNKKGRMEFVPQGHSDNIPQSDNVLQDDNDQSDKEETNGEEEKPKEAVTSEVHKSNEYLQEMLKMKCIDVKYFKEHMFHTAFGRMVLLVRPWGSKLWNIQTSCQVCGIILQSSYENGSFSVMVNGRLLASASGDTKAEAKSIVEEMAWNRIREEVISVLIKEQFIADGDARISVHDVTGRPREDRFGTPLDNSVATKMMKLMGWKGGGLGANAQGIAEPIKPNLQMVNRSGLGSSSSIHQLRRSAADLMLRYLASDTVDVDLVFSSEFSKDERAALHQVAQRNGLSSKSYGIGEDRFLVVKKKLDPFSLARAVIDKGGVTPKYHVFIPANLQRNIRR